MQLLDIRWERSIWKLCREVRFHAVSRDLLLAHQSLSSQRSVSPYGQISIRSNVSGESNGPRFIFGDLTVGMNPNKTVRDALLSITMQASSSTLRKDTNVCFSMSDYACDLALYVSQSINRVPFSLSSTQVPNNLSGSDSLRFNISLLFPHAAHPSSIDRLATWLPMFTQSFKHMDKQWTFSKVTIEGSSSTFDAGYLQANNLLIQTSSAEIKGTFQVNESLTLDTVDA